MEKMSARAATDQQVGWNFAGPLNEELARLRTIANNAFIQKDYARAIDILRTMRQTAGHVFDPKERNKLTELENNIDRLMPFAYSETSFSREKEALKTKAIMLIRSYYLIYDRLVQDLLDNYGFLGDRKKDASKMNI